MPNANPMPRTEGLNPEAVRGRIFKRLAGTTHWSGCEAVHDLCAAEMVIARLTAERDALREALEEIVESPAGEADDSYEMRNIARRALKGADHE